MCPKAKLSPGNSFVGIFWENVNCDLAISFGLIIFKPSQPGPIIMLVSLGTTAIAFKSSSSTALAGSFMTSNSKSICSSPLVVTIATVGLVGGSDETAAAVDKKALEISKNSLGE